MNEIFLMGKRYKISDEFEYITQDVNGLIQLWRVKPKFQRIGKWKGGTFDSEDLGTIYFEWADVLDVDSEDEVEENWDKVLKLTSKSIMPIRHRVELADVFVIDPEDFEAEGNLRKIFEQRSYRP